MLLFTLPNLSSPRHSKTKSARRCSPQLPYEAEVPRVKVFFHGRIPVQSESLTPQERLRWFPPACPRRRRYASHRRVPDCRFYLDSWLSICAVGLAVLGFGRLGAKLMGGIARDSLPEHLAASLSEAFGITILVAALGGFWLESVCGR